MASLSLCLALLSCTNKVTLLEELDCDNDVKLYFISSEQMGPNTGKQISEFQKKHSSFYIDDISTIEQLKEYWDFPVTKDFDAFTADYFLTYTENGEFRGKISLDLSNNIAISGYGPSEFDANTLLNLEDNIKTIEPQFFEFHNLKEARSFYKAIKDKQWLLPSPNDKEYYQWLNFDGESIIQVNNKKFARDKDINKAFEAYMPLRFQDHKFYYNIFRFTHENSTVRICSDQDLSERFPEDFHVSIPWKAYNSVILPLIQYDTKELQAILSQLQLHQYTIIDKIE